MLHLLCCSSSDIFGMALELVLRCFCQY
ncbi:hypothetical protein CFP56_003941 [Quercus suber]|uniref:Uncharacterized protein n=1 Tax=Quercus suber TaxID=58331 RepID=A0AAW0IHH1_QUESU